MTEKKAADDTRSIIIEHEIDAVPDVVWQTLTDPEEISRWFPLQAEVDPRVGGRVWLSWGPGCEGEAPIHIWEPPRRFGWTENYGTDDDGRAIEVAVDFHVEAGAGTTVVRLVQSGFSASSDWDEMYDALVDGWTFFMFNLVFYLTKHRGKPRGMAWRRVATDLARDVVWDRLLGGALVTATAGFTPGAPFELQLGTAHSGEIVSARPGYHFAGTLPDLDNSLLFVELEGPHVGLWLSTYGSSKEHVATLQLELDARVEAAGLGG